MDPDGSMPVDWRWIVFGDDSDVPDSESCKGRTVTNGVTFG
jgi:hypothetical protein